ncbi:MAG: DUF3524 domain-containing protein [Candidatus Omnitrophica bacterium]|nr:DUF3524 domain-containing protein [Candidatus Omnitrophota bacterium]
MILFIEPFYGASHRALVDGLRERLDLPSALLSLPPWKWKWRMRAAAPVFHLTEPALEHEYDVLFASSFLNLAELLGLRPNLRRARKILYFHENQVIYPTLEDSERDYHYIMTQITSALAADQVLFNSEFNRSTFLDGIRTFLKRMPKPRPDTAPDIIAAKSQVFRVPIEAPPASQAWPDSAKAPMILWNHRWEHDKNPEDFFLLIRQLKASGTPFRLAVIGESYRYAPEVFGQAEKEFADEIAYWGWRESREEYWSVLHESQVVLSTAHQEFQGLSVMEAVTCACIPLLPKRLVYPEIYPEEFLYSSPGDALRKLRAMLASPEQFDTETLRSNILDDFSWDLWLERYRDIICPCPDPIL